MKLKILSVEDDGSVGEALILLLTLLGHDVVLSANLESAVAEFKRTSFDLVMTDWNLKARFNGGDVLARLKEMSPGTPVILVCSQSDPRPGFDAYVDKPFTKDQLAAAIKLAMRRMVPTEHLETTAV